MPFGVLPSRLAAHNRSGEPRALLSPLPFGVLPSRLHRYDDNRVGGICLHCLSAFCPPGSLMALLDLGGHHLESPLPFGVLPSRLYERKDSTLGLQVRSPLPFGVLPSRLLREHVSKQHQPQDGLHCLSAFCPPGSKYEHCKHKRLPRRLHCLSAFCPPGSRRCIPLAARFTAVSIAFRRSALPARRKSKSYRQFGSLVSIAFRRSALPALAATPSWPRTSWPRLHCLSAFCPPGSCS